MNSYTSLDVYCRHFGVVAADHSATVCFQVVGGLAVFDVDKERGTKRNELEELPASYERHAERNRNSWTTAISARLLPHCTTSHRHRPADLYAADAGFRHGYAGATSLFHAPPLCLKTWYDNMTTGITTILHIIWDSEQPWKCQFVPSNSLSDTHARRLFALKHASDHRVHRKCVFLYVFFILTRPTGYCSVWANLTTHNNNTKWQYDQFAFRPTGSTTCALVFFIHHLTRLLETNSYVRCLLVDFSKAFDVRSQYSCYQVGTT